MSDSSSRKPQLEDVVTQLVTSTGAAKRGKVKRDDPLLSGEAGFDSFALMELVLGLEDAFGISIPDEDLDPDVFHSVETIAAYLSTRLEREG
jgi:acyl carrier protein